MRRQSFGLVYENKRGRNNITKPTPSRNPHHSVVMKKVSEQQQSGEGLMTMVRNLLPDSDENARPGFSGEKHAILKLPNGKLGVANWMGPNTNVIGRLKRDDPPRTLSDKVAKRHDIDYTLAAGARDKETQNKLIRTADRRMVNKLNSIARNKSDARQNIFLGRRLIQGKMLAEDVGLMKKGSFGGPLGQISPSDMELLQSNKNKLEQEGYGLLPADELKQQLVKRRLLKHRRPTGRPRSARSKRKKGKGINLPGGGLKLPGGAKPRLAKALGGGRMKKSHIKTIRKVCKSEAMKGSGLSSIVKNVIKKLGPAAKKYGPKLLKEVILPIAKKELEKYLKGEGLRLAGQRPQRGLGRKSLRARSGRPKGQRALARVGSKNLRGSGMSMSKSYGTTKNYEMKGKGLNLPGGMHVGYGDITKFIMKQVVPSLAKKVGVNMKYLPLLKMTPVVMKALRSTKKGNIAGIIKNLSKVILPMLVNAKIKSHSMKMSGSGLRSLLNKAKNTLQHPLSKGLWEVFKLYMSKKNPKLFKGSGLKLAGQGKFWKDFVKGFKMIFKPGSKILGKAASALGQPELGIPLEIISDMM